MNGHAGIDTVEATEHLKNILKVGKSESEPASSLKPVANGNMEASGDGNSILNEVPYQKVELCANKDCSHISLYGTNIDIYSSPLEFEATCSQIIVEHMVDYGWEEKYYFGKLISIHLSGLYLAYVLKPGGGNKPGYVRLLRRHLDLRYLIKDYKNEVKDIAFAHTTSQILLGSVDSCGELFVHKIEDNGSSMSCSLLIRILRSPEWTPSEYNRVIWCLYIPDENDNAEEDAGSDDVGTLLVVTHNERAEIWNIDTVIKEHGVGNLTLDEVKIGVQVISEHKKPISAATFSPDGTALSIGSLDGIVQFFQVNTLEKDISPRCLHQWIPHPDKSLSSLYFLDNHKNHRPDVQFWKFAITGAENNTELKVWSCETWACLQTIRIHPNPDDHIMPCLKAEIDLSSKHLFLSDIKRKVLLVLLISQDLIASHASICSLSEYRVPLPVLSLAVANINYIKYQSSGARNSDDEGDRDQVGDVLTDGDENHNKYTIKLFWIQTKTLQSCRILYMPKLESPLHSVDSVSSLSQDSYVYKDGLSDISLDSREPSNRSAKDLDVSMQKGLCIDELPVTSPSTSLTALPSHIANFSNCTEVLLTPDDFTSPSHSNLSGQNSFSHREEVGNSSLKCDSGNSLVDGIDSLPVESNTLQRRKSSQHSATSSPSREVAEILAPTKVLHLSDGIVDENSKIMTKEDVEHISNSLSSFAMSGSNGPSQNQQEYLKEWPQAPDPKKEYLISTRSESELKSHNQCFLPSSGDTSHTAFDINVNRSLAKLNQDMGDMLFKLESLIDVIQDQRGEIEGLKSEIKLLHQDRKDTEVADESNLSKKLDLVISQHLIPDYARLENLILKNAEDNRQRSERELVIMSEEVSNTFSKRLENTLKQELTNSLVPQINRALDTIAQKMHIDFTQKLTATDTSLRDSFLKYLKGKSFMELVAQTIVSSLQTTVQASCKDAFQTSVVPAFERSCHHLFQQLNEIFSKGISEYIQIIEKQGQICCSGIEAASLNLKEEITKLLSAMQQAVQAQAVQMENRSLELVKQQEVLLNNIQQVVHEEVRKALREQQTSVLNSRCVTPAPHSDPQLQKQHLMQLVKQGNLDEAFQQALSAMDVQLVLFLCETVTPDQVFSPTPCPLQQHVLLSLVNQLSADLSYKTELKVRYIEDVIASLDSNNPIIREHIRNVLESLQQRIAIFLQKNPNHKLVRNLKRITLAVKSLIKCQ